MNSHPLLIKVLVGSSFLLWFGSAGYLTYLYVRYKNPETIQERVGIAFEIYPQTLVIIGLIAMFSPALLYYRWFRS